LGTTWRWVGRFGATWQIAVDGGGAPSAVVVTSEAIAARARARYMFVLVGVWSFKPTDHLSRPQ